MRSGLKTLSRRPNTQVAVSLGTGSVLIVGPAASGEDTNPQPWRDCGPTNLKDVNHLKSTAAKDQLNSTTTCTYASTTTTTTTTSASKNAAGINNTQGLVQLRTVEREDGDEALVDIQETSCYVLEGFLEGDSSASRIEKNNN
ncbi:uncharacterized protein LOC103572055 [Microplitis demolitor]|uniref:uncharacterized protein LOC103572055 n=1 Tax=Microplitis demolitor TaxID=69319 RepID=UPI0004CCBFE4|nr:uncharacterized protein LOC103572055 [Microplitis demolitor]